MSGERKLWMLVGAGSAIVAGVAARRAIAQAWRHQRGEEPPMNADDPETSWRSVLAWAAVSGLCVASARVLGRGVANKAWRGLLGREPPYS